MAVGEEADSGVDRVAGVLAPAAGGGKAEASCCAEALPLAAGGTVSVAGDGVAVCTGATTGWGAGLAAGLGGLSTGGGGTG